MACSLDDLKKKDLKTLKEERGDLAKAVVEQRKALEELAERSTDDDMAKFDSLADELDLHDEAIRHHEARAKELEKRLARGDIDLEEMESRSEHRGSQPEKLDVETGLRGWMKRSRGIDPSEDEMRAMQQFNFRGGEIEIELRAAATTTLAAGGAVVGETFSTNFEQALLDFGGMRSVATVMRTDRGEDLTLPQTNDTANTGSWIGENVDNGSATDIAFQTQTWRAHKATTSIALVSNEMLQDSMINFPALLGSLLGERMARLQAPSFVTGDGAKKPFGIVNDAAAGVSAASASAIAADELFDLIHALDPAYQRMNPMWMFNDNTLLALRKLKDGNGQYLWVPGLSGGTGARLLGYEYSVNQHMADIGSSAIPVLFGCLSKYMIRDVRSLAIRRLNERYAEYDQVGFIGVLRTDGRLRDAGGSPVVKLTNAA